MYEKIINVRFAIALDINLYVCIHIYDKFYNVILKKAI